MVTSLQPVVFTPHCPHHPTCCIDPQLPPPPTCCASAVLMCFRMTSSSKKPSRCSLTSGGRLHSPTGRSSICRSCSVLGVGEPRRLPAQPAPGLPGLPSTQPPAAPGLAGRPSAGCSLLTAVPALCEALLLCGLGEPPAADTADTAAVAALLGRSMPVRAAVEAASGDKPAAVPTKRRVVWVVPSGTADDVTEGTM